jgi:hypothetical protein
MRNMEDNNLGQNKSKENSSTNRFSKPSSQLSGQKAEIGDSKVSTDTNQNIPNAAYGKIGNNINQEPVAGLKSESLESDSEENFNILSNKPNQKKDNKNDTYGKAKDATTAENQKNNMDADEGK